MVNELNDNERRLLSDRRSYYDRRSPGQYCMYPRYEDFDQTSTGNISDSCRGDSDICEFLACHKNCKESSEL